MKHFLKNELGLELNIEKTKITHGSTEIAHFLGTNIRITPAELRPSITTIRGGEPFTIRAVTRPQILAPIPELVHRLEKIGVARNGGNPTRFGRIIPFTADQIVNHIFSI